MSQSTVPAPAAPDAVDALIKSIRIPPRPSLLLALQRELQAETPEPANIAKIISSDVGMAGALLKLANSAAFGGGHKSNSIEQAILFLGMNQVTSLMAGLLARKAVRAGGRSLVAFWNLSDRRAQAMLHLSRYLQIGEPDVAHSFGLFCDMGVPLMMGRFPEYEDCYKKALLEKTASITSVEEAGFHTNHAAIGCLLARTWSLDEQICWAILHHHDYTVLQDSGTDVYLRSLVAMSLIAEAAIQRYEGYDASNEWNKGGELACAHLGLTPTIIASLIERLLDAFNAEF